MRNSYEVRGNATAIYLNRDDGSVFETLVDTADLSRLLACEISWHVDGGGSKAFYVRGNIKEDGKYRTVRLHRWLLNPASHLVVDHINNNPLDNRKENLRIVTQAENNQNLKGAKKNSKSGIRGVRWHKKDRKWEARATLHGKLKTIGMFNSKEEAASAVAAYRAKHMPFSKEAMEWGTHDETR